MLTLDAILFDQDYLKISHDPDSRILHLQWKRYATSEQYRDALNFSMQKVIDHGIEGWLGNLKNMESIGPSDADWSSNIWFPQLATTTLKKMAIVTSLDYFNNTVVRKIMDAAEPVIRFETRYFVDAADALDWLKRPF